MNPVVGPALFATVLALAVGAAAQSAPPRPRFGAAVAATSTPSAVTTSAPPVPATSTPPAAAPSSSAGDAAGTPPAVNPPPAESAPPAENAPPGEPGSTLPSPSGLGPEAAPSPSPAGTGLPAAPSPASSGPAATPAGRFHLHRPGTDVDGDLLTGSLASHVFILKGNVTLHSDPKVDRAMAQASESEEPLTVTADEIDADQLAFTYVAKGHVHFVQGTRSGLADLATLNETAHTLDLVGNASVLDGEHRTVAAKMHYDTLDKQFIGAGDVRIYAPLPTPNPSAATPPPKHKRRLPI
jgi:hypothetical protein